MNDKPFLKGACLGYTHLISLVLSHISSTSVGKFYLQVDYVNSKPTDHKPRPRPSAHDHVNQLKNFGRQTYLWDSKFCTVLYPKWMTNFPLWAW